MRDRRDDDSGLRGVGPVDSPRGPEGIARTTAPAGTGEVTQVEAAAATDETSALAAALAAGVIEPGVAQAQLIAATVASMRPAGADPAVWAAIEAEVAALLAGDPTLGDLLTARASAR